jgi:hypothetical protein
MRRLRIFIADDHDLIRHGVKTLLQTNSDWEVCGEARTGVVDRPSRNAGSHRSRCNGGGHSLQKPSAEMENENGPDSVMTKGEIMKYLKGSFATLHKAVITINAQNCVEPIPSPIAWQKTRLSFAEDVVAHDMNHFGQMVEYLRMNEIIPPESRTKKP